VQFLNKGGCSRGYTLGFGPPERKFADHCSRTTLNKNATCSAEQQETPTNWSDVC